MAVLAGEVDAFGELALAADAAVLDVRDTEHEKGRRYYLEHDWVAEEGGDVFESPGETHTLVVPDDVELMITDFQVNGVMRFVDPWRTMEGYEDVFSKIDMCRAHDASVGLGNDFIDQFIR